MFNQVTYHNLPPYCMSADVPYQYHSRCPEDVVNPVASPASYETPDEKNNTKQNSNQCFIKLHNFYKNIKGLFTQKKPFYVNLKHVFEQLSILNMFPLKKYIFKKYFTSRRKKNYISKINETLFPKEEILSIN